MFKVLGNLHYLSFFYLLKLPINVNEGSKY